MFPNAPFRDLPPTRKWETVTLEPGEELVGWVVGGLVTVDCHFVFDFRSKNGRSVPCRALLTDGKLKCHCQDTPCSLRVLGFLPLILKDNTRVVVRLSATVARLFEFAKMGTPVKFIRPKKGKRPWAVQMLTPYDIGEERTRKIQQMAPFDIHEYLLHLWQDKELCDLFGCEFIPSTGPKLLDE